ncbi:MAG: hypothetical protein WCK78_04185 [Paludibacter sp.]
MKTVESKVAETILQENKKIEVGAHTFSIVAPTTATLIQVSKLISFLPSVKLDAENFIYESLSIAEKCDVLGAIAATMILGARKQPNTQSEKKSRLKWLKIGRKKSEIDELAEFILYNLSPSELETLIVELLKGLEIQSFFQVTVSLLEVNLLRATR